MPLTTSTIGLLTESSLTPEERSWFNHFRPFADKRWTEELADDWAVRLAKSWANFSDIGEAGRDREPFASTVSVERVPRAISFFC